VSVSNVRQWDVETFVKVTSDEPSNNALFTRTDTQGRIQVDKDATSTSICKCNRPRNYFAYLELQNSGQNWHIVYRHRTSTSTITPPSPPRALPWATLGTLPPDPRPYRQFLNPPLPAVAFLLRCMHCMQRGLATMKLSVRLLICNLWQNERKLCAEFFYTIWKKQLSFLRKRTVGGTRPLLPEILGQIDPDGAKSPIFSRYLLVAPHP